MATSATDAATGRDKNTHIAIPINGYSHEHIDISESFVYEWQYKQYYYVSCDGNKFIDKR